MIERKGDVFTTDAKYIGHGVNCQGVMGAGIAKTVKEKYPLAYKNYRARCLDGRLKPGDIDVTAEKGRLIVNFATQDKPGPDATYDSVFSSFFMFSVIAAEKVARNGNKIAIPEIGCGIGGLKFEHVSDIILTIENIVPEIRYEVWHYE